MLNIKLKIFILILYIRKTSRFIAFIIAITLYIVN